MSYKKCLEGIFLNDSLSKLLKEAQASARISASTKDDSSANYAQACAMVDEFVATSKVLPIPVLRSMAVIVGATKVEQALQAESTRLCFTPAPSSQPPTADQERFQRRLERLRVQNEERSYAKLTKNVGGGGVVEDDVTTRSMTYAASIGLNMIVAPLSFGCFMYFFAGGLLNYIWPREELVGQHDIRKVIAGVVSGVLMLFIEMLLFVIRTHEMDRAMRRKDKKRKKSTPFGSYTANSSKTYVDK